MTLWMVRAGRNGEQESRALEKDVIAIGWRKLPDLSKVKLKDELKEIYTQHYPEHTGMSLSLQMGQVWSFIGRIQEGDLVALPLKAESAIAIGKVKGPYVYTKNFGDDMVHVREVKWIRKDIPRTAFDQDLLYSLGAAMTVCRIERNNAEERIKAIMQGKTTPIVLVEDDGGEAGVLDLEQHGRDLIQEYINRKFKGHGLARLIDAVLKADGYFTYVSKPGPDGGIDIFAGAGPMGFESPKIVVQVKSSESASNLETLRSLRGVVDNNRAEYGLLVSWGGFQGKTKEEGRTQFFNVRMWDSGDIIETILKHYHKFPDELQAELPLKRIWTLVQEDE